MMKTREIKTRLVTIWPGLPYLSFGLWLAWTQLTFGAAIWISDIESSGTVMSGMWTNNNFALSVFVLIVALLGKRIERYFNSRTVIIGGLLACIGAIFIILCGPHYFFFDPIAVYLAPISLVAIGVGFGIVLLRCMELYSSLPPRKTILYVALSVLESTFIYFFVVHSPNWALVAGGPSFIKTLFFVGLPLATAVLAVLPPIANKHTPTVLMQTDLKSLSSSYWKLVVVCAILPFIVSLITAMSITQLAPVIAINNNDIAVLLQVSLILLLLIFAIFSNANHISLGKFYSIVAFLLVIVIATIPIFGESNPGWLAVLSFLSNAFIILLWLLLAFVCYQKRLRPLLAFGLAYGIFSLFNTMGWMVANNTQIASIAGDSSILFYLLLAGVLLVLMFILFPEKTLEHLFSPASEKERSLEDLLTEKVHDDDTVRKGRFTKTLEKVAQEYHLSRREAETLRYLAMGRGSDYIASQMIVSLNTVRVHTHNVYNKTGVHSRQELIDLVDNIAKN